MQRPLIVLSLLGVLFITPAPAQDAIAGAKAACENLSALGATGDAAKLADNFYTEKAMFIGPMPVAGILVGRDAIRRNYAEAFKTFKAISGSCEDAMVLNETTVAIAGHWTMTPSDPNGRMVRGSFGMTFVKEDGKWLAALDSWNVDLAPPKKE